MTVQIKSLQKYKIFAFNNGALGSEKASIYRYFAKFEPCNVEIWLFLLAGKLKL